MKCVTHVFEATQRNHIETEELEENMIRSFNGKTPIIAESAFISEAAYIVGDVSIGENSSVWPGAVVRGDLGPVRIGNHVAIEDCCVIHSGSPSEPNAALTVGDYVYVGHGAVINCLRVGNRVLIGMNATLLHDVVIGDYCIIGAACLVGHGMKIPDRSFVTGAPGKIKGEITEQQLWWVQDAIKGYDALCRQYKEEGL